MTTFPPAEPPNDQRPAAEVAHECLRAGDDQARMSNWGLATHNRETGQGWATLALAEALAALAPAVERLVTLLERIDEEDREPVHRDC